MWFGIHFGLWKSHGTTPLWLLFQDKWGRASEVRPLIEPWAAKRGMVTVTVGREEAIALRIPDGEDKAGVIRALVDDLKDIASIVGELRPPVEPRLPAEP